MQIYTQIIVICRKKVLSLNVYINRTAFKERILCQEY